jgi:hypothetical protein
MDKYSLEIISKTDMRQFRKYNIEGEKVIGVYENEPFIIRFKNNTWNKVQVRISVDGTDVLTGKLAHTETTSDGMWVVNGYQSMELKAWPETNEGGAEFLFGKTKDSVAANTHGNLSAKGLIAIAVFEETPKKIECYRSKSSGDCNFGETKGICRSRSLDLSEDDHLTIELCRERGPAVGAGDYTEQHITKTAGLNDPKFAEIVQLKYEWWTSLRSKIRQNEETHTAFPGDKEKFINLGSTPRIETENGRINRIRREDVEEKKFALRNRRAFVSEQKYVDYQRFE